MNAPAKPQLPAKVPVRAGGQVAALVPQSMEEAFRVAQAIAASGLAPRGLDKPEQVLVAIMAGAELGLAPFQSLQSIAVVNGRATVWGDGLVAIARAQGVQIKEWVEGEADAMVAHCEVTRPDSGEMIPRSFSVADAKKAGLWGKQGPWQQYPRRMLQMRARAYALRDGCADMLRGLQVREEVEDYQTVREVRQPEATGMRARLEARPTVGGFDPEQIETELAEVADAEFTDPPADDGLPVRDDAPEAEVETFPGDLPLKTGAQLLAEQQSQSEADQGPPGGQPPADGRPKPTPLADRVNAVKVAMAKVQDRASLDAIWARAEQLRKDCEAADPEGLFVDLEDSHEAAIRALEAVA